MRKIRKRYWIWTWYGLFLLFAAVSIDRAQTQPVLLIEPGQLGLKPADQSKFSLQVQGVQDFYGVEAHLQYDEQILEILDADTTREGVQCKSGSIFDTGFIAQNNVASGRIDFAATLLNPAPAFNGDGILMECQIRGKNIGNGQIHIINAILANRNGEALAFTPQDGIVEVSESGIIFSKGTQGQSTPENATQANQERRNPIGTNWLVYLAALAGIILFVIALVMAVRVSRRKT